MGAQTFLYPRQRQVEVLSAIYAGGFGLYIETVLLLHGVSPIGWVTASEPAQHAIAGTMVFAALIHGAGIKINGRWQASPALRLIGMTLHFAAFAVMWLAGAASSATYSYAWVLAFLGLGAINAARDCRTSLRGPEWKPA